LEKREDGYPVCPMKKKKRDRRDVCPPFPVLFSSLKKTAKV
jgi:hypothetical protein